MSACKLLNVQVALLQVLESSLPWETLGAIPEMLQTAWGSLFKSLQLKAGDRLLIRGGTTSVGLAAASIAKKHGAYVAATTRSAKREELVKSSGADHVFIDDGAIAEQAKAAGGFDKVGCCTQMAGSLQPGTQRLVFLMIFDWDVFQAMCVYCPITCLATLPSSHALDSLSLACLLFLCVLTAMKTGHPRAGACFAFNSCVSCTPCTSQSSHSAAAGAGAGRHLLTGRQPAVHTRARHCVHDGHGRQQMVRPTLALTI